MWEMWYSSEVEGLRYVLSIDDISATLTKMADDIQTPIGNSYLWSSDVVLDKIRKYN